MRACSASHRRSGSGLPALRGIPTHRSWVRKIRFAPGKGNQKLIAMYSDGAEVWDTKEVGPVPVCSLRVRLPLPLHPGDWAGGCPTYGGFVLPKFLQRFCSKRDSSTRVFDVTAIYLWGL